MIDLSVKLLCTSKAGALSRLIRRLKDFGFQYHNHKIEVSDQYSEISIDCNGELLLLESDLRKALMALPEVMQILDLSRGSNKFNKVMPVIKPPDRASVNKLDMSFEITPMVIKLTERRLARHIGAIAPFVIRKAMETSQNVGELYIQLAKELDEEYRVGFLSIISFKE